MSRHFATMPAVARRRRRGITGAANLEPLERRALLSGTPLTEADGFGYQAYTHTYEAIDLQLIPDVENGVARVGGLEDADDWSAAVSLEGNTFNFYGTTYSQLFANTNGVATENFNPSLFLNTDLTTGGATIAPLWDDWRTDLGGEVLRRFDDLDGNGTADRLIVEWSDVRGFVTLTTGSPHSVTFQLILQLNTGELPGDIVFNYVDTVSGDFHDEGARATVGIKADGNQGPNRLLVSRNTRSTYLQSGNAIIITKNRPPTLNPGGPYQVDEGGTVTLTAGATDPDGDALSFDWDVDRNGTFETIDSGTVDFSAAGLDGPAAVSVPVRVSDGRGHVVAGAATVNITNVRPTLAPSGADSVDEGSSYALTLGAVTDPGLDTVTSYVVHWGDGISETVAASPSLPTLHHTYADGAATATISVDVVDDDGTHAAAGTKTVTVDNVAPTVALSGPATINEGGTFALFLGPQSPTSDDDFSTVVVDPGTDTVTEFIVDWGDGTVQTILAADLPADRTLYHVYADDGARTVSVDVEDEDGRHDAGTTSVAVANVAPTISLAGPASVNEGSQYVLSLGPVVDPGADTVAAYVVDWGDGSVETVAAGELAADRTVPHTYVEGAAGGTPGTVSVQVVDEDDTHAAGSLARTVNNVAPTFSNVQVTPSLNEGGTAVLTASVADAGALDSQTVTIDWGDGSPVQTASVDPTTKTVNATHKYADDRPTGLADSYGVTLTVTDDDGDGTSAGASVAVANVAPAASFTAITNTGAGYVVAAGVPVGFQGTATDPGADPLTAVWEISDDNFACVLCTATGVVNADGTVSGSFSFSEPGVYKIRLVVKDDDGGTATADRLGDSEATVVVYDSTAGYVTGGGWINSPAGSYAPNPSLTGTAHFAFISKYRAGSSTPIGTTQFFFKAAGLHFSSFSYEFMVVSGYKAQFRGTGTLNGNAGYRFKLTAIDGQRTGGGGQDKFRIQIWNSANTLVYDNQRSYDPVAGKWVSADEDADPVTALVAGSIIIRS